METSVTSSITTVDIGVETCGPRAGVALSAAQAQTLLDRHLPGRRCVAIRYIDRGYNNRTYVVQLDAVSKVTSSPVDGAKVTNRKCESNLMEHGSKVAALDINGSKFISSVKTNPSGSCIPESNVPIAPDVDGLKVSDADINGSKVTDVDNEANVSDEDINKSKVMGLDMEGSKVKEPGDIGPEIIVRLGGRFWNKRKTENEVACLTYLRDLRPQLPVPRVLFYGSNRTLIGAEYIGMELLPGRPLDEAWLELDESQRLTAVGQLAEILAEVRSLTFDTVGNLGFRVGPGKALPDSTDVFVDRCFEVDRGPMMDYGAFAQAIFQSAMNTFMTHSFFRPLCRVLAPRLCHFARACFKERRGAMADALAGPAVAVMTHYDLEPRNVLVDARGDVTGLLDWEFAGAFPADVEWFVSLEFLNANTAEASVDAMTRAGEDALSGAGGSAMNNVDYVTGCDKDDMVSSADEDAKNPNAKDIIKNGALDAMSRVIDIIDRAARDAMGGVSKDSINTIFKDTMNRLTKDVMVGVSEQVINRDGRGAMDRVAEEYMNLSDKDAMNLSDKVADDAKSLTGNDALSGAGEGAMSRIRKETNRYRKHFMAILESRGMSLPPKAHRERHLMRADFWTLQDNMAPWYLQEVGEEGPPEAVAQRDQCAAIVDAILRKYGF